MARASSSGSGGGSSGGGVSSKRRREAQNRLEAQFVSYSDLDGREITIEGTQRYFEDLGVALDDVLILPLCYYLGAPLMGKFTRQGWVAGWLTLDVADTLELQKQALPTLRNEFDSDAPARPIVALADKGSEAGKKASTPSLSSAPAGLFKKVYEFTFGFARPEGQKSLGTFGLFFLFFSS